MHRLLKRQLNRHLGPLISMPDGWEPFLSAVSAAYEQSDSDRLILERTNELSSQELLELNSQIRAAIPDNFLRIDKQGTLLDYKPGQNQTPYLRSTQVLGKPLQAFLPEVASERFTVAIAALEQQNLPEVSIVHDLSYQGNQYFYEVRLLPLLGNQVVAIARDITARKQAEAQLQRTNEELLRATRLKDEFLANMSHELRTPLNAILGMTEGLQEDVFGALNDKQKKALQTVESSGVHLLSLINDILDVAKIESGQIELDIVPTALAPLCKSSLTFIKQQAFKKRIQLETKLPETLPNLLIDERRMRQVLINLLNNAVKFTPDGGHITLAVTHHQPQHSLNADLRLEAAVETAVESAVETAVESVTACNSVRIAIIDTGIGIEPQHINKLFQPFIQIDSALNRQYNGTGLGLALVKRIVELHGGQVSVTSTVGVGSTFSLEIPCKEVTHVLGQRDRPTTDDILLSQLDQAASPLILLAEDNEANISTFSSYLRAKGYRMLLAHNGLEAIALARTERPDLILMDVQMPQMDGLEAMENIRRDRDLAAIPMIALTALAMEGDRERCLAAGANDYLSKPVKLKHLLQAIQAWLKQNNAIACVK